MISKPFTRRVFLAGSAIASGSLVAGTAWFRELLEREPNALSTHSGFDYGPLAPVADSSTGLPLLELPKGFSYVSFGWAGDAMRMAGEPSVEPTPDAHDGMGCFSIGTRGGQDRFRLIRNHERETGRISRTAPFYDPAAGGGTTTLIFDGKKGELAEARVSLAGTLRNCAGGATPWKSWVSCEETTEGPGDGPWQHEHGFCFEVPSEGVASARPLHALGRFKHEAIAFEPAGHVAYLTEDNDPAGLFRFLLERPGDLRSGTLQMLRVRDEPRYDTRQGQRVGEPLSVEWVTIEDPSPAGDSAKAIANGPTAQGLAQGAALFRRLEGVVFSEGHLSFASTTGGDAGLGQIWGLDVQAGELRLVYESKEAGALECPDNLAVSPRGDLIVCEDGPGEDRLLGLSPSGEPFPLVRGRVRLEGERGFRGDFSSSEITGACWSADGRWLFFNIQRPGITFAVTGPWVSGSA